MARRYFTTPIYYVNDRPHIGHLYTTVVTDTLARFFRQQGEDVRLVTGTDEHGQNIEKVAKREGVAPIAVASLAVLEPISAFADSGSGIGGAVDAGARFRDL